MWETFGRRHPTGRIQPKIEALLAHGSPGCITSSVGRLFDAVAYLAGIARQNLFEGQAAMLLESAIGRTQSDECYEIAQSNGIGDWASTIEKIISDKQSGVALSMIALKFHNALANWILAVARESCVRNVVLSGGVFQNAYLTMRSSYVLEANGFTVFTHHQVPANDGGLALGQAVLAGQVN
jgi:hydrogenase maturation protein HypF